MSNSSKWYKDAIIYEVHVRCFYDSDGDGIGDFAGLTQKLDYLQELGVTAIWLLPFYPSPLRDDGYDIAGYVDVHPTYGTLHDFRHFLKEAHLRGLKVITELVINHTSDQHPWFQRARKASPGSKYRNYYVWSDNPSRYNEARIIFQDFESSNWTFDPVAKSYYWHRFYSHQPDLNYDNPEVENEIMRVLQFWLKMGVDGLRLDAVPYLYEREGTSCENLRETHALLKRIRSYVDENFEDRMLLAEANQWPEDASKYFGEGDECHMAFHFPMMPRLFMAIHLEDSLPIIEIAHQTPSIPENCQWALFLRNHDELTLEMVTDEERDYMFRVYAHDVQARLNLGIRRRLAPLLQKDRRKIELMNTLLFSLGGTPILYYGDEIGMGDNIYLGDRNGVRTPMQWTSDRNAGFSKANPQKLYLPPIIDPEYHYETVNVEAQIVNPFSLFRWTKQLITLRKRFKAFGHGVSHFLLPENRKVLVFLRQYENEQLLFISNLSRFPQYVELDLAKYQGFHLIELFSGERFPKIGELPYFLTLGPYGYYWFALEKEREVLKPVVNEPPVVSIRGEKGGIFKAYAWRNLESYLYHYLKDVQLENVKVIDHFSCPLSEEQKLHLVILQMSYRNRIDVKRPLILSILHGEKIKSADPNRLVLKFKIVNGDRESALSDVTFEKEAQSLLFSLMQSRKKIKGKKGELRGTFFSYDEKKIEFFNKEGLKAGEIEEENCTLFPLERCFIRCYRELAEQNNSNSQVRLALQEKTTFQGFLPLLGIVEYHEGGKKTVLAEEMALYSNEFNAQKTFLNEVLHFLEIQEMEGIQESPKKIVWSELVEKPVDEKLLQAFGSSYQYSKLLGEFTADYHLALLSLTNTPFSPVSYSLFYQQSLYQNLRKKVLDALTELRRVYFHYPVDIQEIALHLFEKEKELLKFLEPLLTRRLTTTRIYHHGNFVLDNLMFTGKEFFLINLESKNSYKRNYLVDSVSMIYSLLETAYVAVEKQIGRGTAKETKEQLYRKAHFWGIEMGVCFLNSYFKKMNLSLKKEEIDFLLTLFFIERCAQHIKKMIKQKDQRLEIPLTMLHRCFYGSL